MAGESPDGSKQRESSAEQTSGSAGPVPGKPDPRLAVTREAEASKSESGESGDTATRILSVRTGGDADAGGGSSAEDDEEGRLHEAIATWVRPAEPDSDADAATPARSASGAEDEATAADDAAPGGQGPDAAPGAGTDTGGVDSHRGSGEEASTSSGTAAGAADADAARPGGTGAAAEDTDASDDDSADRPADGGRGPSGNKGEDAPADEGDAPKDEGDTPAGGDTRSGSSSTARDDIRSARGGNTAPGDDEAPSDASPTAPGARRGDETGDSAPGAEAAAQDSDATPARRDGTPDAEEPAGSKTPTPSAHAASPSKESDENDEADDKDSGTRAAPGSGSAGTPGARGSAHDDSDDSDTPGTAGSAVSAKDDTGPAKDKGDTSSPAADRSGATDTGAASDGDRAGASRPVDQPTAVLRTRKPTADQPTTMLKLGGTPGAASGTKDTAASGTKDTAASGDERTSKYVALKDDPAVRTPSATALPAEATTTLPHPGPERTRQVPLPPRPPLDLLAELTNTPPPPQTPLRTALRRIKIWSPLVLLLLIILVVVQVVRPLPAPTLELTAQNRYTFEGGKPVIPWPAAGQAALDVQGIGTFGSSGEQDPVPIASVAKVMTAYLILRDHPLKSGEEGPMITIDKLAQEQSDAGNESTVDVIEGDQISQREALEAVLIASANNVARLLARWDAGSEEKFVEKMNEAAQELGMTRTTYTDPSGLEDTTVSTAVDQVKLARVAMEQPAFREVAAMMSYDDYKGVNHSNWNHLVGSNNVVGIKTGTTTAALGNLVFAAKKDVDGETRTIIGAVVRQPAGGIDNTILSAALTAGDQLIRAAQDALESSTVLKKGEVVGYVDDGLGSRTPVVVTKDVKAVGWAGLSVKLRLTADELPRQAKAGTTVGTLTVGDGSGSAVKIPVALQNDLTEPGLTDKLTRLP